MVRKNIFANYLGTVAIVTVPLLAIPWYLSALGTKVYGLVGFIATIQALLSLLDAGLSQALVREFAQRSGCKEQKNIASILYMFERVYWIFAFLAGIGLLLFSYVIANNWLKLGSVSIEQAQLAVYGAAILFAVQFPSSLYRSLLLGTQEQVLLNKLLIFGVLIKHLGAIWLLTIWPSLFAYLAWQILITLLETITRAISAWKIVKTPRNRGLWIPSNFSVIWKPMTAMMVSVLLGALTVQLDKIVLSKMVTIEQFGYYSIASTIAMGALQAVYPLTQAVLPRLVSLHVQPLAMHALNVKLLKSIGLVVFVIGLGFVLFGKILLSMWLYKTPQVVGEIFPLISLLLIGSGLNAVYNVGYCNWLAQNKYTRIIQVNVLSLVLSLLLLPYFIFHFGMAGAAFGWLVINFLGSLFSLGWVWRH